MSQYGDAVTLDEGDWLNGVKATPQGSSPTPRSQARPGEDLNVRAYADQYFGGDYGAAQRAIQEQRARRGRQ